MPVACPRVDRHPVVEAAAIKQAAPLLANALATQTQDEPGRRYQLVGRLNAFRVLPTWCWRMPRLFKGSRQWSMLEQGVERLEEAIRDAVCEWSLAEAVTALQACEASI